MCRWYVPQYILIATLFIMYVAIIVRLKAKVREGGGGWVGEEGGRVGGWVGE